MTDKKLFNNAFLNFLSKTNALFAIGVYVTISIVIFTYGVNDLSYGLGQSLMFFVAGLLFFTFIEYLMHRFLYHSGRDYMEESTWQYKMHGVHHQHPRDKKTIAMPIPIAFILAAIFYGLFYLTMGRTALVFFPGFFVGYALYLFVHYLIHSIKPPDNIFNYLWLHHHLHHHQLDDKAFGVSSPLWDVVFGTMPPKKYRAKRV